jgi:hypothetical protein
MKFLLTVFICSVASGDCYTNEQYPKVFPNHHDCIRAGLSESYEVLFAEGNFTEENINNLQLYPKFICNPVKDEGQITT